MVYMPATMDLTQIKKKLQMPEIRVWCHPHFVKKKGDDYYYVFPSFKDAFKYIKTHKEAEDAPVLAFRGYELNLFELKDIEIDKDEDYKVEIKKKKQEALPVLRL